MSISLPCSGCQRTLVADEKYAGRRVRCAGCGAVSLVPVPQETAEPVDEIEPTGPSLLNIPDDAPLAPEPAPPPPPRKAAREEDDVFDWEADDDVQTYVLMRPEPEPPDTSSDTTEELVADADSGSVPRIETQYFPRTDGRGHAPADKPKKSPPASKPPQAGSSRGERTQRSVREPNQHKKDRAAAADHRPDAGTRGATLTEAEILKQSLACIERGRFRDAAALLRQSRNPVCRENITNCESLANLPDPFLLDMLKEALQGQLKSQPASRPAKSGTRKAGARTKKRPSAG